MKKLLVIAAGVAGYVLGARAGRERYEQIKDQSTKVWNSPTVQHGVDEASEVAKQAASAAGSKVADAASQAGSKVASAVKGDDSSSGTPDSGPAAPVPTADDGDEGPGPTAPGSPIASPSPAGPPTAADLDPGKP